MFKHNSSRHAHRRIRMGETILSLVRNGGFRPRVFPFDSHEYELQSRRMGLDGVELVMAAEERFAIVIEDADAEKIRTPRDLIEHIAAQVGCADGTLCATQRAFHRLRSALMRHCGLKRAQIRPQRSMSQLLPFKNRREIIRKMLNEIGIAADPEMVRPKWLVVLIVILSLITAAALAARVLDRSIQSSFAEFVLFFTTFSAVAVFCGCIAACLTRGLRCRFKPAFASVGNFCRWMVMTNPESFGGPTGEWTREQIAEQVRSICIEQLGLPQGMYREDADFIKDFGVD